jgi:hypothetical protein
MDWSSAILSMDALLKKEDPLRNVQYAICDNLVYTCTSSEVGLWPRIVTDVLRPGTVKSLRTLAARNRIVF